jgi:nucleoside-diphosphate-sugar epimerase
MACKMFDVSRVLYVSSAEVYGEPATRPMKEDHQLNPLNTYAVSKLAADRLCYTFLKEHDIPVLIARIFNCYGPRETEPYVIPEIITQLSKGSVLYLGNVEAKRDFTYVADTAKGLIATICSSIPDGEAVNIGSGRAYSIKELVDMVAALMEREPYEIRVDRRRLRKHDINVFHCDNSRLREATGWRPTVDIPEGLSRTIDWFNTHGKRWSWEDWIEGTILYDSTV